MPVPVVVHALKRGNPSPPHGGSLQDFEVFVASKSHKVVVLPYTVDVALPPTPEGAAPAALGRGLRKSAASRRAIRLALGGARHRDEAARGDQRGRDSGHRVV